MDYKEIEGIDAATYAGKAALAVKTKARGIFGDDLLTFHLLDFVGLMMLNNKFANQGIFITDDNREECYIKIIESGDESLIADLEKYLELKDKVTAIEIRKKEYDDIVNNLCTLSDFNDSETVNQIVENYLRR
jgi:hypothetical protein